MKAITSQANFHSLFDKSEAELRASLFAGPAELEFICVAFKKLKALCNFQYF